MFLSYSQIVSIKPCCLQCYRALVFNSYSHGPIHIPRQKSYLVTHIIKRRRLDVLREVDGLDVDDVEVVGQARVGAVALALAVGERDRLDEVVVGLFDDDAELSLASQRRVDDERSASAESSVSSETKSKTVTLVLPTFITILFRKISSVAPP